MSNGAWFAGRLREVREQAGLTQQALADKAGLTREGVAQLETGRRRPAWETVLALCSALGVSCEAFTQAPASTSGERSPGRPPKPSPGAAGTAQESGSAGKSKSIPSGQQKGARKRQRKRKGER